MEWPTTKNAVTSIPFHKRTITLFGYTGIGKSKFCSEIDKALFLSTDPRSSAWPIYEIPITSWEQFIKICIRLRDDKPDQFETIVIDTTDFLIDMCANYFVKKNKIQHMSDLEFGKGWSMFLKEFSKVIIPMTKTQYGWFFVFHAKEKTIKSGIRELNKIAIDTYPKVATFIQSISDCVLYARSEETEEGEKRFLISKQSELFDCSDKLGLLEAKMPLNYKKVIEIYDNNQRKGN